MKRFEMFLPFVGAAVLLAVWSLTVWARVVDPVLLPSPVATFRAATDTPESGTPAVSVTRPRIAASVVWARASEAARMVAAAATRSNRRRERRGMVGEGERYTATNISVARPAHSPASAGGPSGRRPLTLVGRRAEERYELRADPLRQCAIGSQHAMPRRRQRGATSLDAALLGRHER